MLKVIDELKMFAESHKIRINSISIPPAMLETIQSELEHTDHRHRTTRLRDIVVTPFYPHTEAAHTHADAIAMLDRFRYHLRDKGVTLQTPDGLLDATTYKRLVFSFFNIDLDILVKEQNEIRAVVQSDVDAPAVPEPCSAPRPESNT